MHSLNQHLTVRRVHANGSHHSTSSFQGMSLCEGSKCQLPKCDTTCPKGQILNTPCSATSDRTCKNNLIEVSVSDRGYCIFATCLPSLGFWACFPVPPVISPTDLIITNMVL